MKQRFLQCVCSSSLEKKCRAEDLWHSQVVDSEYLPASPTAPPHLPPCLTGGQPLSLLLPPALRAVLPEGLSVPCDGPTCDKHVWWLSVCLCVFAYVRDTSAGLCCYQIDMSVCEALLFSDVPHTGSWSLCVCVCVCARLPSSAVLETDGPWHLPFERFSLWKMSSSSDPTCVSERRRERERERWCFPQRVSLRSSFAADWTMDPSCLSSRDRETYVCASFSYECILDCQYVTSQLLRRQWNEANPSILNTNLSCGQKKWPTEPEYHETT